MEILLAKELKVERGRREKELQVERGRREKLAIEFEKEIATTKEEVSRRLLDFITSSSYKGLRDLVEVRNDGDPRK